MTPGQTKNYIKHRLQWLGWAGEPIISRRAVTIIYGYTGGLAKEIDQLCDTLLPFGKQQEKVTTDTVKLAIRELNSVDHVVTQPAGDTKTANEPRKDSDILFIEQLAVELESKLRSAKISTLENSTAVLNDRAEGVLRESDKPAIDDQVRPTSGATPGSEKPKVLVVNDSATVRTIINTALKNDFTCLEAHDGAAGWNLLLTDSDIGLAIADLEMPALDGYGLIKRIKTSNIARIAEIPILVITSAIDTIAKKEAYTAGADDFITKSTDPFELLVRVRAHYKPAQAKSEPAPDRPATRPRSASPQGHGSDDLDTASLDQRLSVTSELLQAEAKHDGYSQSIESNFREAVGRRTTTTSSRWPRKPSRGNDAPANPTTAITLAATVLVLVVIGFSLYQHPLQPVETAETIKLAAADAVIQGEQAVNGHQQPARPPQPVATRAERSPEIQAIRETQSLATTPSQNRTQATESEIAANPTGQEEQAQPSVPLSRPAQSLLSVALQSAAPAQMKQQKEPPVAKAQRTESKAPAQQLSSATELTQARKAVASEAKPLRKEKEKHSIAATRKIASPARAASRATKAKASMDSRSAIAKLSQPALSLTSPAPPLGEKRIGSPRPSKTLPDTSIAKSDAEAKAEKPASGKITISELGEMVTALAARYEAGDLNRFMSLFAKDAPINEKKNRAEIRKNYEDLFQTTDLRQMALRDLSWDLRTNRALGWGNFDIKLQRRGEKKVRTYRGSLALQIERRGGGIRITRLYHSQEQVQAKGR